MLSRLLAAFCFLGLVAAAAPDAPVRKIDRMFVVGAPLLDADAKPGVYVWLEDQHIQVAFVGQRSARVRFVGSEDFKAIASGDFSISRKSGRDMVWSARPRGTTARGRFKSPGNLKVSEAKFGNRSAPLYVGPLPRLARPTVDIGRY